MMESWTDGLQKSRKSFVMFDYVAHVVRVDPERRVLNECTKYTRRHAEDYCFFTRLLYRFARSLRRLLLETSD